MNMSIPLCSFGKQIARHLCDWSKSTRAYRAVACEELDACIDAYTISFIIHDHTPYEHSTLECYAFQSALDSKDVSDYAAELGRCTDKKQFEALVARVLLHYCMDIPNDILGEGNLHDTARDLIHCYISGLVRKLAETFGRDYLKVSRSFLLDQFPSSARIESNTALYASRFEEPLCLEQYGIYDSAAASLRDCYVSPTYCLTEGFLDLNSPPLENLLQTFLFDTVCPELAELQLAQRGTILIRGPHDSGKTSILYKLAHDLTTQSTIKSKRFWGIDLKFLTDANISAPDKLLDALLNHLNCDTGDLQHSILCLDGIDDLLVLSGQENLVDDYIRCLAAGISKIPGCKCIVTTSSGNISGWHSTKLCVVDLLRFSPEACRELIHKYAAAHPSAKEYLLNYAADSLPRWPGLLYASLALNLPMAEQTDYWSARISKMEQLRKDSNHLQTTAETLALSMMEHKKPAECSQEAAHAYANYEDMDITFLRDAYGLTLLGGNHCTARFCSSDAMYYLAARKMEKEATSHLLAGAEDIPNLRNWCNLFSKFPLSEKFLSYYSSFLSHVGEKTDTPFPMINASLTGIKLLELLSGNIPRVELYLKNLPRLCHAYRDTGQNNHMDVSGFMRWVATAGTLGAQLEQFVLQHIDFLDDIQHVSLSKATVLNCVFINCRISFCRIHGTIQNTQFSNTVFNTCDISHVDFCNCQFFNCRFEHCDMTEVSFSDSAMKHTVFADCDLNHSNIHDLRLSDCTFENSRLRLCEFRDIDCCTFKQTDISSTNFSGLDLRNTELEDLYMSGVYGANFWKRTATPNICFKGCSILLQQVKNIYQFLEDISDVKVFNDDAPDQLADPLMVSCEYLFCKGQPIPQDELREFADRFWPDGIVVDS